MKHKGKDKVREDISKKLNIEYKVAIFGSKIFDTLVLYHYYDGPNDHKTD